jgi:hypothetical protein
MAKGRPMPSHLQLLLVLTLSLTITNEPPPRPAVTVKLAANPKPLIFWYQVHGRWHWHCLTHCSKYPRRHESPGEEVTEFDNSSGHYEGQLQPPQERPTQTYVDPVDTNSREEVNLKG